MSYANPQGPGSQKNSTGIDTSAMAESRQLQQAREQQRRNRTMTNANALAQGVINSIGSKKEALKEFTKGQKRDQQNLYNDVASYSLGYEDFNKKSDIFFHDLIDKYSEIQGHLNNGTMVDEQLGRQDLAKIKNLVNVYGDAVPRMQKIAAAIDQASNDPDSPQLSVTGAPPEQMQIITKIVNGDNIDIIQDGDSIILKDPDNGAILNVGEFNKAFANNKNPYLKYEADVEKPLKTAFTNYMKDDEDQFTSLFTTPVTRKDRNGDDVKITTMTLEQQDKLRNAMIGPINKSTGLPQGQFTDLIRLEGESIWEDVMDGGRGYKDFDGEDEDVAVEWFAGKNSVPVPGDPEFPLYKKQYDVMLNYLSTRALEDNAAAEGIELDTLKPDDNENKGSKDGSGPKAAGSLTQEEFNKKWNTLKPGESLVGPNGVEYTKKYTDFNKKQIS